MKCQHCEKPATFHITELTGGSVQEVHLCEDHARDYLTQADHGETPEPLAGSISHQMKVGQTAEDLVRLDQAVCPMCGITFYEFRHQGRLGCPHDYVCFAEELEPLIMNIHGETTHTGKRPRRCSASVDRQTELIRLRREMKEAIEREDYEQASVLRDQIRKVEQGDSAEKDLDTEQIELDTASPSDANPSESEESRKKQAEGELGDTESGGIEQEGNES